MPSNTKPTPINATTVINGLAALPWGATLFGAAPGPVPPQH